MTKDFNKLKEALMADKKWPQQYMFKFIVPNDNKSFDLVKAMMPYPEKVTYRTSKDIRYIAMSYKQYMKTPQDVIDIYEKVSTVENVIIL